MTNFFQLDVRARTTWQIPSHGDPEALDDRGEFSAKYHVAAIAANFRGRARFRLHLPTSPLPSACWWASTLPPTRHLDYVCLSGTYSEDVTRNPAAGRAAIAALPPSKTMTTGGASLQTGYEQPGPGIVKAHVAMTLDRPSPVCRAADYAKIRPQLSDMVGTLLSQILYK